MKLELGNTKHQLELAISIAIYAHEDQTQWNGSPYILHPLHLMNQFDNEFLKILAVLHDSVEDSGGKVTLDMIRDNLGDDVADRILLLTHDKNDTYGDYINEIALDKYATAVKIADLEHNMDVRRIGKVHKKLATYIKSWKALKQVQRINVWA